MKCICKKAKKEEILKEEKAHRQGEANIQGVLAEEEYIV